MKKKIISMILIISLTVGLFINKDFTVSAEDSSLDAITDGLEFMSDEMAQSYIGFIYNVRADLVTDEMKSVNDIFNYLTGRLEKGTDEYVYAQMAYLITADSFVNRHITEGEKVAAITTENLITILEEQIGGEDSITDAVVNEAIGNVEKTIKKLMYYLFEYDESDFFQNLDLAMSGYKTVVGLKGKVKDFVATVEGIVNAYLLAISSNSAKAYNYYSQYVMLRDFYDINPGILVAGLSSYNIGNISAVDGVTIFFDKIGFGNSWTNEDVQKVFRIFGEFRYHSMIEAQANSQPSEVERVSFVAKEYTIFFNYILTNPAIAYPNNASGRTVSYSSEDTTIATVDANGKITPVNPGTVKIYAQTENGVTDNCTIHILPFTALNNNGEYSITGYAGNGGSVSIPSEVEGKKVTTIGRNAFRNCDNITEIIIPNNIREIGHYAFYDCGSLTSVTLSDGLTNIGTDAFGYCRSLTSITIPSTVTNIGDSAFERCSSLERIDMLTGVVNIGGYAFFECSKLSVVNITDIAAWCNSNFQSIYANPLGVARKLYINGTLATDIVIPDGVTKIGDYAFEDCRTLKSISIPDSVTSIGKWAFYWCTSLTDITIPKSVESIGVQAFVSCTSLTSIELPNGITNIDKYTFEDCSSLTRISIPNSVTNIDVGAFQGCSLLANISVPNSVTNIGDFAFRFCDNLTSVVIPNSVENIGEWVFMGCSSLTNIEVDKNNKYYSAIDGVMFDKGITALICYPMAKTNTSYVVPKSVTSIDNRAFYNCNLLTSLIIPDGVTSIGDFTFVSCDSLTIYCNVGNVSELLTGTEYKHKCFGDFDGDKTLSDIDIAKMRESLVGILDENYDETVADYNQDKEFDVRDLVRLKKAIVK